MMLVMLLVFTASPAIAIRSTATTATAMVRTNRPARRLVPPAIRDIPVASVCLVLLLSLLVHVEIDDVQSEHDCGFFLRIHLRAVQISDICHDW